MAENRKNQCPLADLSEEELQTITAWEEELAKTTGQKIALVAYRVG
ncbi:MAG TPA: hypothetical protein GXX47_01480 [Firmicutes bacterium]|nr:hypothetical protein [Bacillota bacterium]